jgi:hypothetical protein
MKLHIKISIAVGLVATLATTSCKKSLKENPTAAVYSTYLNTQAGIFAAITGVYSGMRGNVGAIENQQWYYDGTDELLSSGNLPDKAWATYNGLSSGTTSKYNMFNGPYQWINTLNGAIQYAGTVNMDANTKTLYVAQAKFLRAYLYFYLLTTFGNIPLHTTFNTSATTADSPAAPADVYNQIIQDLTDAAAGLPNTITASDPFSAGGVGKTGTAPAARAYLAKLYLTRAYTSFKVATDFQMAADITADIIAKQTTYNLGLWQDYTQAQDQANDYGKETLFALDMGKDPTYGNIAGLNQQFTWIRWNYVSNAGINSDANVPQKVTGAQPMLRDFYNGRPFIIHQPSTTYTINTAFAEHIADSRFDATFQTFWICNIASSPAAGLQTDGVTKKGVLIPTTTKSDASYAPPTNGDTAILFPGVEVSLARRNSFKGMITTPSQYSNVVFPTVKKYDDKVNRSAVNDLTSRPYILMRFSEVYMMNAEANYMLGNTSLAAASLNVIRQRAAFRTPADGTYLPVDAFKVTAANMGTVNAANAAAMALTPTQLAQLAIPNNTTEGSGPCGMDLILDEYTREFFGDARRWYDLARTGQLIRRVKLWNPEATPFIKPFHILRPIPQNEIDAVLTGPKYPQNPGY